MTKEEALELLSFHSFSHDDIDHPKMEKGFIGMLKPFTGKLYEENFHELMTILWTLRKEFQASYIDRKIMSNLFGICHYGRAWGLDPDGMLQRNNLLTAIQIRQLEDWTNTISYCISSLLEGCEVEAFDGYPIPDYELDK